MSEATNPSSPASTTPAGDELIKCLERIESLTGELTVRYPNGGTVEVNAVAIQGLASTVKAGVASLEARGDVQERSIEERNASIIRLRQQLHEAQVTHSAFIAHATEVLHAEANERSFCSEFDDVMERAGLPRRERDFDVNVTVTLNLRVRKTARSDEAAMGDVDYHDVQDVIYGLSGNGIREALDTFEADEAYEADDD